MSGTPSQPGESIPEVVHVTSYPKIIFLWPTWVLSFGIWLVATIAGWSLNEVVFTNVAWIWMIFFCFNIFVIAFEFSAAKVFFVILGIIAIFVIFFFGIPGLISIPLPTLTMHNNFHLSIAILLGLVYLFLWITRHWSYLEITTQNISYHVGVLADERRYPAPDCRFEKITTDVFERLIPPFCAKLVMKHEGEAAEILDCVPWINSRLKKINQILEFIKVRPH